MAGTIYVLDRITVRPGRLRDYQARLRERYLPLARSRGMTLVGQWFTPPVELDVLDLEIVARRFQTILTRFHAGRHAVE